MSDQQAGGEAPDSDRSSTDAGPDIDVEAVVAYLEWGTLAALGILAVIAGIGLYTSLSTIIDVWISARYQPFARVAFNFAVLCVAAAGMFTVIRRL